MTTSLPDSFSTAALPEVFNHSLALYWQRLLESAESENQAKLPELAAKESALPLVWCASDFIASWCIRQPQSFTEMLKTGRLTRVISVPEWRAYQAELVDSSVDEKTLDIELRAFRQRCMVQIAWRDIAGLAEVEETITALSRLAEVCLQVALSQHQKWLAERAGTPRNEAGDESQIICLGLGKLGGGELNFSSDIDLIFAYSDSGQTDGSKVMDNQAFFTRLVQKVVGSLDRVDAGGFVFRTDLRLRPNGESGPVVLSFAAMEHYYQTHGRDWERYALIKARVVAGVESAGKQLTDLLRPFVYRKYLDYSAFDSIREMKHLIERQLGEEGVEDDVKLGRGGIREIEFLVQNFQLIRGGREQCFRTQSLYKASEVMIEQGLMEKQNVERMIAAYRFLRTTEHRLQMVADRQTQILPSDETERCRLAVSMGFADWAAYLSALDRHRDFVQGVFNDALTDPVDVETDSDLDTLSAIWRQETRGEQAVSELQNIGIERAEECLKLLQQFYGGKLYQAYASVERQRLDRLMPLVLKEIIGSRQGFRTVSAFISIVEAIGRRSVYLSLLIENPIALQQLLKLCSASPWISRHIGRHPVVLDELIQPLESAFAQDKAELDAALKVRLAEVEPGDEEAQLNALREFYHARVLRIAAADVSGKFDTERIHLSLTHLAELLLQHVLKDAMRIVEKKQGKAPGEIGIIAYGKFAGSELGYHSDLDIVVCFEPAADASATAAEYYFSRVGQKLVHLISARTQAGVLFELDMRLRPSGRSGTLVTSLKGFAEYQNNNAWVWEHQALVRAKMVVGSAAMQKKFEAIRRTILTKQRSTVDLAGEIVDMRNRMREANSESNETLFDLKLDRGGIVDIEFLLQYLVLSSASNHPEVLVPRSTNALIAAAANAGLIPEEDAVFLCKTYIEYLRSALHCKLMDQPVRIAQDEMQAERQRVKQIWQSTFS